MSEEPKHRAHSELVNRAAQIVLMSILGIAFVVVVFCAVWLVFGGTIGPAWQALKRDGFFR